MIQRPCVAFLLLWHFLSYAQEPQLPTEHVAHERTYDVLHYKLNIGVDLKSKTCAGDVGIKLVPLRPQLDEVRLDAAE
ncbi:MAG: hypothetical protein HY277_08440, partial [Ignavibacteriales bacterium]|nr:hypothetical protein [Ignavibacteriales bacterium]